MVVRSLQRVRRGLLVALVVALVALPLSDRAPGTAGPAPPTAAAAPALLGGGPAAPSRPLVTTLYDWDPQPFVLPPSFPADQIAGEGAAATTSDPFGTVLLFGGETPSGLTNRTVTANQSTANWDTAPVLGAPTPRANASIATVDHGRYAVLFGGLTNLSTGATDNQTWTFDFVNRSWENRSGPVAPPAREAAAFAADDGVGFGVLEGGLSPSVSLGGGGASVLWNDTWLLNLTTFAWSRANASGAPRPDFGASLVAVPPLHEFELFGGCATFCSNALYDYQVGGNWTPVGTSGDVPTPRGGASSAWSPVWNLTLIFGGFVGGGNGYVALNDSYVYDPVQQQWSLIAVADGPSARYGAAATYLSNNQCPGLLVVGGSSALAQPPPDGWFLDSNPDYGNGCNNWGGDQVGGPGGGPGNCTVTSSLYVDVLNSSSGVGIPNATVSLVGRCGVAVLATSATGFANFTALPNETVQVVASAAGFHSNQTYVNLSFAPANFLTQRLDPLPFLEIRTYGESYLGGLAPLANVSVVYGSLTPLGSTDDAGFLNVSGFSGPQGPGTFFGYKANYSNGSTHVTIPWTGSLSFSILLLADGAFDVHVVEWPDLSGIAGAFGAITPVGAYTFGGPVSFSTDLNGWFNTTLPQANYTVSASAGGFARSVASPRFHAWVNPTVVVVNLTALFASNLSVRLVSSTTGAPIAGGRVTVGYVLAGNTSASGWANFSEIRPPGVYGVVGSAPGYRSNSTAVDLTYLDLHAVLVLPLTPISSCPPACESPTNGTPGTYRLLPPGGTTLDLFVLAPVALALAGAAYVIYLRRRSESGP